ncbi:MAG TPA: YraN family protein [Solirubrobacteraceae bacterium]
MSSDSPQRSKQPPATPVRCPADRLHEDPRRTLGRHGERLAAAHLQRLGFAILARNVRTRHGEIDLIACDDEILIFVEVKTRRSHRQRPPREAQPLEGLRARQRSRLRRLAAAWLQSESRERRTVRAIRFDAIGVIVDEADCLICLDHIVGAW